MSPNPTLSTPGSPIAHLPEVPQPILRVIDFSAMTTHEELLMFPNAPKNAKVCVRVDDGPSLKRSLTVFEVTEDGTLKKWNGSELLIDFKARENLDWICTLVVIAVELRGSTPRVESRSARVKLKGTIHVGDD